MGKTLVPLVEVKRTQCPFYGFGSAYVMSALVDTEGNQCPLKEGHSPCYMEVNGQEPNWNGCSYNSERNKTTIRKIIDSARIFPRELNPGGESWRGISMQEWLEYLEIPLQR